MKRSSLQYQLLSFTNTLLSLTLVFALKAIPLIIGAYAKIYFDSNYNSSNWSWTIAITIFLISFFTTGYLIRLLEKPLENFTKHIEKLKRNL